MELTNKKVEELKEMCEELGVKPDRYEGLTNKAPLIALIEEYGGDKLDELEVDAPKLQEGIQETNEPNPEDGDYLDIVLKAPIFDGKKRYEAGEKMRIKASEKKLYIKRGIIELDDEE